MKRERRSESTERPLSLAAVAVLKAVADGYRYGFDIMDATTLPSGTVYPILSRFEESGLVRSQWERPTAAQKEKRPPRRYYELLAAGARVLETSLAHYRTVGGLVPLAGRPAPARGRG